ncbi:FAD-linked oxidase [Streptomyces swartbergensis]|uniref:FAD-linked oxidase n=1 Tax=Streptomyces swartbergensis TaxID=487165 RepID=A0A2C9ZNN6_9ACTN|nr:FAD-linked oxidase [Streptomyces swartbergensis]
MGEPTRRHILRSAAVTGGAAALTGLGDSAVEAAAGQPGPDCRPVPGAVTVSPDDFRYPSLNKSHNGRFTPRPDAIIAVYSPEQAVRAVEDAVRVGKRIAVRSGGHCYEDFVTSADVRIVLDVSQLDQVSFDSEHQAFSVEAGATLGKVYKDLYYGWGVTIPGGSCPSVGVGGHIAGGGYGNLSRRHGMVVDHLYGVEVIVVDRMGKARRVVATRRSDDPHRDLWWAHTGGGGGNFGVVLRYLLRSPQARGRQPGDLLPRPPATAPGLVATWQWAQTDERAFITLVRNHGGWHERHPHTELFSSLALTHRATGTLQLLVGVNGEQQDAGRLMEDYLGQVTAGVGAPPETTRSDQPWLTATLGAATYAGGTPFKSKAAFLRRRWTDRQIGVVHQYLTDGDTRWGTSVHVTSFGGEINAVAPDATAFPHRDALFSVTYGHYWTDPEDHAEIEWIRRFYQEVHAETGGVPVPGDVNGGCYVNYPDADLADPKWNTSGVPWHTLYYRDNYPRLQRVKARWDPRDVFRHALSVRPPA